MSQDPIHGQQKSFYRQHYIQGLWCPGCAKNLTISLNKKYPNNINSVDYSSGLLESSVSDIDELTKQVNKLGFSLLELKDLNQFQETQKKEFIVQIRNLILSAWTMMWLVLLNFTLVSDLDFKQSLGLNLIFFIFILPNLLHSLKIGVKSLINGYPNIDSIISLVFLSTLTLSITSYYFESKDYYFDSFAMSFFILNLVRYLEFKFSRMPILNKQINKLISNSTYRVCKTIDKKDSMTQKKIHSLKMDMFIMLSQGELAPANIEVLSSNNAKISTETLSGEKDYTSPPVGTLIDYGSYIISGEIFGTIKSFDQKDFTPAVKSISNKVSVRVEKLENFLSSFFWVLIGISIVTSFITYSVNDSFIQSVKAFSLTLISINFCIFYLIPSLFDLITRRALKIEMSSRNFLLKYGEVEAFIFDKTGTLEKNAGNFKITRNDTGLSETEIFSLLGGIEEGIHHPIAHVIAEKNQIEKRSNIKISSRTIESNRVTIVDTKGISWEFGERDKAGNLILRSTKGECVIQLNLEKDYKMIKYLKDLILLNKDVHILTGDSEENLNSFLEINEIEKSENYKASLNSAKKLEYLELLNSKTLVIADGINDLEMVKKAYLAISMPHSPSNLKLLSDAYLLDSEISHEFMNRLEKNLIIRSKVLIILVSIVYSVLVFLIIDSKVDSKVVLLTMVSTLILILGGYLVPFEDELKV